MADIETTLRKNDSQLKVKAEARLKVLNRISAFKIRMVFKLTQYLTNFYEMRFLMKNYLKYILQCKNGIFEKTCRATRYPNQYYGSPLTIMYTSWYGESPSIQN